MAFASKVHFTGEQKSLLVQLLEENPDLASGAFSSTFTQTVARQQWRTIADRLNAIPGAKKHWKQWRKAWQDLKSKTKTKYARQSLEATDGGALSPPTLEDTEQKVIRIIGSASVDGIDSMEELRVPIEVASVPSTSTSMPELIVPSDVSASVVNETTDDTVNVQFPYLLSDTSIESEVSTRGGTKRKRSTIHRLEETARCSNRMIEIAEEKKKVKENYYSKKIQIMEQHLAATRRYYEESLAMANRAVAAIEKMANNM